MFGPEPARVCDFTVRCKGCGENIPAPVGTLPDSWIVAQCALCGERRRYLPTEIFRGHLRWGWRHLRCGWRFQGHGDEADERGGQIKGSEPWE